MSEGFPAGGATSFVTGGGRIGGEADEKIGAGTGNTCVVGVCGEDDGGTESEEV